MKRISIALAILSWALLIASLCLPAVSLGPWTWSGTQVTVEHEAILGWQAAWAAIGAAVDMHDDWDSVAMFVHGVTNLLLLAGPIIVVAGRQDRWRWLAHVTLVATLYNLCVGWELDVTVQVGYYLWVAAFVAATVSLYLQPKSSGDSRTMSSNYGVQQSVGAPSSAPPGPSERLRAACS